MAIRLQSLGEVSSAAAGIVVSGSTNATPIVITLGANHGLKDGDRLAIAGVTGNTGANGEWSLQFTGANTARLLGSVGNGTHGGTVRAAVVFDRTPLMRNHSAMFAMSGNLVGTLDIEAYETYADFAAGQNNAGAVAPAASVSGVTNSAGSASTPAKSTIAAAATNAGLEIEVKLGRYMRAVATAYTSGSGQIKISA
jgi:hypothetical protein